MISPQRRSLAIVCSVNQIGSAGCDALIVSLAVCTQHHLLRMMFGTLWSRI
jgi:hypothetical protein